MDGHAVAALHPGEPEGGVPVWANHVSVTGVDAVVTRAVKLGATAAADPFDVGDAGRTAVLRDPEGAFLSLWEPRGRHGAELVNAPGALVWNELGTRDRDAAQRFYGALFGWTFEADGDYVMIFNGGARNGGIRRIAPEEGPTPAHWLPTFGSADLDATVAAVGEAGGIVLAGPMDVGPGRFAVIKDPQRTPLALYDGDFDP